MVEILNLLPKNWNDISLSTYQELKELEEDVELSNTEFFLEQIAILLDTSSDDTLFDELDIDELCIIMDSIGWLKNMNFPKPIQTIQSCFKLELKPFNKITLGEFIDIEHYIQEPIKNLHIICSILYRKTKPDEWNNIIFEPYEYNIQQRSSIFNNLSINLIYSILTEYINFRTNFMESYKLLFEQENYEDDDIEDIDSELKGRELIDSKIKNKENQVKQKWSWEGLIWELSNHDITKFDEIFNSKLIMVFNTLSMKKSLGV